MNAKLKLRLYSSAAVALLAYAGAAAAEEPLETVTVTGIRASLQSAQTIKQNSDQVVDSVTAVDIGALPDRSVAEALQRIPGVQISRNEAMNNPDHWAGYGNGVFIRGLSWVQALTNGLSTFGAENGRTLSFADISADLMVGVDVYKNPNAKMIEGGVGGTVDLRTRKPFDQDGLIIAASANATYGDISDRIAPAFNLLASDRWNTRLGEVGVLFSADYENMVTTNDLVSTGDFNPYCYNSSASASGTCSANSMTGKDVQVPYQSATSLSYRRLLWKQPRISLYGALQWRPTEQLELGFTALFSKAEPQQLEHLANWVIKTDTASLNSYNYDSAGNWTGGTVKNAESFMGGQTSEFQIHHHINAVYSLDAKWNPTDALTVSANLSYTDARSYMYSMTAYLKMQNTMYTNGTTGNQLWPNAPIVNVTADLSGDTPNISYAGDVAGMTNKANYTWGAAMDHLENNYAHNYTARADATYTFPGAGLGGYLKSAEFGFRTDLRQAVTRQTNWNWGGMSFQTWYVWAGMSDSALLNATGNVATQGSTAAQNAVELFTFKNFFGGKDLGTFWLPKISLLSKGGQALWNVIGSTQDAWKASGTWVYPTWQPIAVKDGCKGGVDYLCSAVYENSAPASDSQLGGVENQKENTYAGYLQLNFAHDTFFGSETPIDGNIGVRIVATEDDSGAGYSLLGAVSGCGNATTVAAECVGTDAEKAWKFVGNTGYAVNTKGTPVVTQYTDILPSFNLRAHLSETLQARFAFSQQIVRPAFVYTENYTSLGFAFQPTSATNPAIAHTYQAQPYGRTGVGGNPYLKPMHANNYDASLEWYFAPTGSVALGFFHKDLTNYVTEATLTETYTRNNITQDFLVTRYVNGDKGKVEGFEFAYQQFFDSLPGAWSGVGLQVNYTKIYNSGGANTTTNIGNTSNTSAATSKALPIEGMSHDSYNIALLYAKYDIDARLAYNWRSRYLMSADASNYQLPTWQRNYGQLDGSLIYTFLEHYKAGVQVTNILKTTTKLELGYPGQITPFEWVDTDRKISLVLRANW